MTKAGKLIRQIETGIKNFFTGNEVAEKLITGVVTFLLGAETVLESDVAIKLAALIPNGIGTLALTEIQKIITEVVPTAEIAQEVENDVKGITDPAELTDAILTSVLKHMKELPAAWQGKHFVEVATLILSKMLDLPLAEIEILVRAELEKINNPITA